MGISDKLTYVLGDDSFTLTHECYPINLRLLAQIIDETFGVRVNVEKSMQSSRIKEIKFLGRYCHNGYPVKDMIDVVLSALYPHRTDESDEDTAQRILALYYDNAGGNSRVESFLRSVWDSLDVTEVRLKPHIQKKFLLWGLAPPEVTTSLPDALKLEMLVNYPLKTPYAHHLPAPVRRDRAPLAVMSLGAVLLVGGWDGLVSLLSTCRLMHKRMRRKRNSCFRR